jgi:hypothetical protein
MSKCIATFYQQKYLPILKLVVDRFKIYADKCKADLKVIEIPEDSVDPQMDKFFYVNQELNSHKQYLIIDIDILVRKDSPDIFDIVGTDRIGIYNEGGSLLNAYDHAVDDEIIRWTSIGQLIKLCNLDPIEMIKKGSWNDPFFYFNSGVIVASQKHLDVFGKITPEHEELFYQYSKQIQCSEQALVNYNIFKHKIPVMSLPACFNQMAYNRSSDYLDTCYFSHYAGLSLEDKLESMKKDHKKWSEWGY